MWNPGELKILLCCWSLWLGAGKWEEKGFCRSRKEHELNHELNKKINPDYYGEYIKGKKDWGLVKVFFVVYLFL